MEKTKMTCKDCGRNVDCYLGRCSYCSRLDFLYSQGAMTLDNYNKCMKEWSTNKFIEINGEIKNE